MEHGVFHSGFEYFQNNADFSVTFGRKRFPATERLRQCGKIWPLATTRKNAKIVILVFGFPQQLSFSRFIDFAGMAAGTVCFQPKI
ncbi:MAG: hypothetical protein ACLR8Y_11925 [Alistipes indistinctus]